jgi:hypothetical protein
LSNKKSFYSCANPLSLFLSLYLHLAQSVRAPSHASMKFTASIKNGFLLHKILSSFDRSCAVTIKITADSFRLICQEASQWQACVTIEPSSIFDLPISLISQAGAIHLQVQTVDMLCKAFRSLAVDFCAAFKTTIKLAKVANNCTALLVTSADPHGNIKLEHTVPVNILTPLQAASMIQEPDVGELPQLQLLLPGCFRALKAACDNLKQFKHLKVIATSSELTICTPEGPFLGEFSCKWSKLKAISLLDQRAESGTLPASCSVTLETKELCRAMQAVNVNPSHGIVSVVNEHCLLLYFFLTPNTQTSMSYFLPNKLIN